MGAYPHSHLIRQIRHVRLGANSGPALLPQSDWLAGDMAGRKSISREHNPPHFQEKGPPQVYYDNQLQTFFTRKPEMVAKGGGGTQLEEKRGSCCDEGKKRSAPIPSQRSCKMAIAQSHPSWATRILRCRLLSGSMDVSPS